jgi:3-oxoadipate enol-lactonase
MPKVEVEPGFAVNCEVTDYLWPWEDSTPVLMHHGFCRNATFWRRWIPQVSATRRIYRPEVRGCGQSDVPPPGSRFSPEMVAGDIRTVLDTFGVKRVHWVGESSGGVFGLVFASTYPERVASLTLLNTPVQVNLKRDTHAMGEGSTQQAILKYGVARWARETLSHALDVSAASSELQDFYVSEKGKTPAHVAAAILDCAQTIDTLPLVSNLKVPVLLMGGGKRQSTVDGMRAMERELPHVQAKVFDDYGKAIHVVIPELCAKEACAFWDRVDAAVPVA